MTSTTLADPIFNSIINKGEPTMNNEPNAIDCQTGEERPSTTLINPTPPVDSVSTQTQTIQGVSGASYAPMDTSPTPPNANLNYLMAQLTATLTNIIEELTKAKSEQTNLEEAVSVALEQADWFRHRVEDAVTDTIRDTDLDYEIGNSVERYMENGFDANDHVDFQDLVNDRVDDVIEDMVAEKVQDILEERLASLIEEKLANANITINF
jgi:hypothetical protein